MTKFSKKLEFLWVIILLGGCAHPSNSVTYGIQADHLGFVPARIAVLNCSTWPNRTQIESMPPTNIGEIPLAGLCTELDKQTLEAFSGQPYMRGYSPAGVMKVLERNNQVALATQWTGIWKHQPGDCSSCPNAAAFYEQSIQNRVAWRDWLQQFSQSMNQTDAILLPFVVYGREHIFDDRGLWVAERDAHVAIFLISTETGDLIWAGGRSASARTQRLQEGQINDAIAYPDWKIIMERLFTSNLWREFPGRQQF